MSSVVRAALIQTTGLQPLEAMLDRPTSLLREAAGKGAQVACLQELATGPYFCQTENPKWFDLAEEAPNGPTTSAMQELAQELNMVLVVPLYEKADGCYYNTAVVIDSDGSYLGNTEKTTSLTAPISKRSSISTQEIWGTPCLTPQLAKSVSTFVMTGIFLREHEH